MNYELKITSIALCFTSVNILGNMDSEINKDSVVPKKGPNDFIFGRVLGDGSFSTVNAKFMSVKNV